MKRLVIALFLAAMATQAQDINYSTQLKNKPFISVTDAPFYAVGDGVTDNSAAMTAAYNALPSEGGTIWFPPGTYAFGTGQNFNTANKSVLLWGADGAKLLYTGTTGTAITFNYGQGLPSLKKGIDNLVLTGPGSSTSTTGLFLGGTNGAESSRISNMRIEGFGTGVKFGDHTFLVTFDHGVIHANGTNVIFPQNTNVSGENMRWNDIVFSDSPPPFTNGVWVMAGEHHFVDCSFDSSQLHVGNGTSTGGNNAQVFIRGAHFENPNWAQSPSTTYAFVQQDNNGANYTVIQGSYVFQANTVTIPQLVLASGGTVAIDGLGMFSYAAISSLVTANGATNVKITGLDDISCATNRLTNGNSTGSVFTWANSCGPPTPGGYNTIIGSNAGTNVGGGTFDVTGQVRATYNAAVPFSGQVVALAPTGTAPFVVNSTTQVNNLVANMPLYAWSPSAGGGVLQVNNHAIFSQGSGVNLIASPSTYAMGPPFSDASSYTCMAQDTSTGAAARAVPLSGTQMQIYGTPGDNITFFCFGI